MASTHKSIPDDSRCLDFANRLLKIRSGCPTTIAALLKQLHPAMKLYLRRRIGMDYENALRLSFLDLLEAIQTGAIQNPSALRPFLCSIMARHCKSMNHGRLQLTLNQSQAKVLGFGAVSHLFIKCERDVSRQCLEDALDRIPLLMQSIIKKLFIEDKSDEQVMIELGISEVRFRRARSEAKFRLAAEIQRMQSILILKAQISFAQSSSLGTKLRTAIF